MNQFSIWEPAAGCWFHKASSGQSFHYGLLAWSRPSSPNNPTQRAGRRHSCSLVHPGLLGLPRLCLLGPPLSMTSILLLLPGIYSGRFGPFVVLTALCLCEIPLSSSSREWGLDPLSSCTEICSAQAGFPNPPSTSSLANARMKQYIKLMQKQAQQQIYKPSEIPISNPCYFNAVSYVLTQMLMQH